MARRPLHDSSDPPQPTKKGLRDPSPLRAVYGSYFGMLRHPPLLGRERARKVAQMGEGGAKDISQKRELLGPLSLVPEWITF